MVVKQGEVRQWHFAHKALSPHCSYESYLHRLAKRKIHEWFYNTNQLQLVFSSSQSHRCSQMGNDCIWWESVSGHCKNHQVYQWSAKYDLKKYYNSCDIEREYKGFRADLFIYGENRSDEESIFIEICVKHPCTQEKVDSGIRIIEMVIESEADIDSICNSSEIREGEHIKLYNFRAKPRIIVFNNKKLYKFILSSGNTASFSEVDCKTYANRHDRSIFELTSDHRFFEINYGQSAIYFIYQVGMAAAHNRDYPVRDCFLCRYHRRTVEERLSIFCCLYKQLGAADKYCKSTKALECKVYRVDKELCNAIEEKIRYDSVDIWEKKNEF